jgi:tRNA/tmRNA/rRNA uracil-C5-methylase (TrmA/RlmC/RlmD family)
MPSAINFEIPVLDSSSPDRADPLCPYFGRCGGCQLQNLAYSRQLAEKEKWLRHLARGLVPEDKIRPIIPSPAPYHYRRRVQFQVGPEGEVGFFAFHSQQVVDVRECVIADPAINHVLPEVRKQAREILASPRRPTLLSFEVTVEANGKTHIRPQGAERSFLQVNPAANEALLQLLQTLLRETAPQTVLELFAGEGNLTSALARVAKKWTAVEANPAAVRSGREQHACDHVTWIQGDAAKVLAHEARRGPPVDFVLLDPPRQGAKECMPTLVKWRPPAVLYVSCNPQTLMRDLRVLTRGGYEMTLLQPFDFFPQTTHLETAALLTARVKSP